MKVTAIPTHCIYPGESLISLLDTYITKPEENTIIAITSKVISLCQNRLVKRDSTSKAQLIEQEADAVANVTENPYGIYLTIKDNMLIPSAGIDESNVEDSYILLPENPMQVAKEVWQHLKEKHQLKNVGVIITDSHTTPMRRGVTGITLAWCGFKPLYSYVGKQDLHGHPLRVTQINLLDALATTAVMMMGEGKERTPLSIIQNAPKISFVTRAPSNEEVANITISVEDDLYSPLFTQLSWET